MLILLKFEIGSQCSVNIYRFINVAYVTIYSWELKLTTITWMHSNLKLAYYSIFEINENCKFEFLIPSQI